MYVLIFVTSLSEMCWGATDNPHNSVVSASVTKGPQTQRRAGDFNPDHPHFSTESALIGHRIPVIRLRLVLFTATTPRCRKYRVGYRSSPATSDGADQLHGHPRPTKTLELDPRACTKTRSGNVQAAFLHNACRTYQYAAIVHS